MLDLVTWIVIAVNVVLIAVNVRTLHQNRRTRSRINQHLRTLRFVRSEPRARREGPS